jgi:hypothetical protein
MKKNMKNKLNLIILMVFAGFSSCTNDSLSDLGKTINLDEITYNSSIKSIIDNNCLVCHGEIPANGATNALTTYENVKEAAMNRDLLDRISRTAGTSGAMPLGGQRLPQTDINAVSAWIDANFPQ